MRKFYSIPYYIWIALFVIAPLLLLLWQSFQSLDGSLTLENYKSYFTSSVYLKMTLNSVLYAGLITLVSLLISYPMAYIISRLKMREIWLMLIILPTWINLLLKAYAFMGILGHGGTINQFISLFGFAPQQILFTNLSFILVASYINLPFMILPIYNALIEMDERLIDASLDLGASRRQTFLHIVFPLSMDGVRSGVQAVFIPSLSLFMIVRLIGGNRVITLGTAVQEHFLVTQNWGLGSTIGVILIIAMIGVMYLTREKERKQI
ncbi:MAG: ABC transporter permease [Lactovum sp.]